MSEEKTEDLQQKYQTKPTIETVLERLNALEETLTNRFNIRFDRIEAALHQTQSDFHSLRADFTELREAIKEHFPSVVK